MTTVQVSPQRLLLFGWLLTDVQVNITTAIYDTGHTLIYITLHYKKRPCPNPPNSDVDNGGAEPKDVGVGIFRPPHRLVRATDVHIGISRSIFYGV